MIPRGQKQKIQASRDSTFLGQTSVVISFPTLNQDERVKGTSIHVVWKLRVWQIHTRKLSSQKVGLPLP